MFRRSGRITTAAVKFTPAKCQTINQSAIVTTSPKTSTQHRVDYELNKTKAIKRKLEATARQHSITAQITSDNVVLTFSAAAYQEFKSVTFNYLQNQPVSVKNKQTTDKNGAIVSESVTVTQTNKLFVLNFYNSTSKVLLNGKQQQIDIFISEYLNHIMVILDKDKQFNEINAQIRSCCTQYLQTNSVTTKQGNKGTRKKTRTDNVTLAVEGAGPMRDDEPEEDVNDTQFPICQICMNECDDTPNSVACDMCNLWYHYECERLSAHDISSIEDSVFPYECNTCLEQGNVIQENIPVEPDSHEPITRMNTSQQQTARTTEPTLSKHISNLNTSTIQNIPTANENDIVRTPQVRRISLAYEENSPSLTRRKSIVTEDQMESSQTRRKSVLGDEVQLSNIHRYM